MPSRSGSPASVIIEDSDDNNSRVSSRNYARRGLSPGRRRERSPRRSSPRPRTNLSAWRRRDIHEDTRDRYQSPPARYPPFERRVLLDRDEERGRDSMNISPGSSPPRYADSGYRQPLLPLPEPVQSGGGPDWNAVNYPRPVLLGPAPAPAEQFGYPSGMDFPQQASQQDGARDVMHFELSTLIPPAIDGHVPKPSRDRPHGCRTIFVGGLPDKITDDVLKEVFSRAGPVVHVRLCMNPRRNFAHIRFASMEYVDNALLFSGYRIHVQGKTLPEFTGRMHVDYAVARDDQADWEESLRHQEEMRSASDVGIKVFGDAELHKLGEDIKSETEFASSASELVKWMDRGNIEKKNFNNLYSMLQSTIAHMRRLNFAKQTAEEEFAAAKQLYQYRVQVVSDQMNLVEKVFMAASRQKIWDKFTKPQRKNIEGWRRQLANARATSESGATGDVKIEATEMDLSDSEENERRKAKAPRLESPIGSSNWFKEENETLRFQLDAYRNEVSVIKSEMKAEIESKEKQLQLLQQTLQNLQKQQMNRTNEIPADQSGAVASSSTEITPFVRAEADQDLDFIPGLGAVPTVVPDKEAKLIGVLTTFLHIHPMGAGVDYILSYVQRVLERKVSHSEIDQVLKRYPGMFTQWVTGVGANMERKWISTVFENCQLRR